MNDKPRRSKTHQSLKLSPSSLISKESPNCYPDHMRRQRSYHLDLMGETFREGFLSKEGKTLQTWNKRYLVIEKEKISYYTSGSKKKVQGTIPLISVVNIKPHEGTYKGKKNVIDLVTQRRTFYFKASDDRDRAVWLSALTRWHQQGSKDTPPLPFGGQLGASSPLPGGIEQDSEPSHDGSSEEKSRNYISGVPEGMNIGLDDFEMKKVIGRGRYGKILLVVKKDTGKVFAMKIIRKYLLQSSNAVQHVISERNTLIKLENPFLAKLHYAFQNKNSLYLIMEYYAGGELFFHMQKGNFSEDRARFYAAQIVSVLEYIHQNGIMYRDLKPENLLLNNEGNIVLIDFGGAKEGVMAETVSAFAPEYYAPEILAGKPHTKAVDWWSLGTIIFDMMTGSPPFFTEDQERMFNLIEKHDPCIPSSFSPEVTDLIKNLLNKNPEQRLSYAANIRKHPWFASIDWELLEARKLRPPYIPSLSCASDVVNIDQVFLNEDIQDSDEQEDGESLTSWTYNSDHIV